MFFVVIQWEKESNHGTGEIRDQKKQPVSRKTAFCWGRLSFLFHESVSTVMCSPFALFCGTLSSFLSSKKRPYISIVLLWSRQLSYCWIVLREAVSSLSSAKRPSSSLCYDAFSFLLFLVKRSPLYCFSWSCYLPVAFREVVSLYQSSAKRSFPISYRSESYQNGAARTGDGYGGCNGGKCSESRWSPALLL